MLATLIRELGRGGGGGAQHKHNIVYCTGHLSTKKATASQIFQFATARTVARHCIKSHGRDTTKETNRMEKKMDLLNESKSRKTQIF